MKTSTKTKEVVKVGDIFEATSIYYSNRTKFVKVVSLSKTGKTGTAVQLQKIQVDGDWMNGNVSTDGSVLKDSPFKFTVKDTYKGKGLRGRLYSYLDTFYPWDGEPIWNNCD